MMDIPRNDRPCRQIGMILQHLPACSRPAQFFPCQAVSWAEGDCRFPRRPARLQAAALKGCARNMIVESQEVS